MADHSPAFPHPTSMRRTLPLTLCMALLASHATAAPVPQSPAAVVTIHFDYYRKDRTQLRTLERRLDRAIKQAGAGELGETELHEDGNDGYLYLYGANPDRLYAIARPILKSSKLTRDADVTKRSGARKETLTPRQTN